MRGFPLVNALVIVLALGAFFVPLRHLTRPAPESGSSPEGDDLVETLAGDLVPVGVSVRFAHSPVSLTLSHLGEIVWRAESAEAMKDGNVITLPIPPEGIDLMLHARWPEGTPETVLELTLTPEALPEQSAILWGEGEVEDVLTFVWGESESS